MPGERPATNAHGPSREGVRPRRSGSQERFLQRRLGKPLALHLSSPALILEGVLVDYDDYTLLLRLPPQGGHGAREVLVFKHAVAFIS